MTMRMYAELFATAGANVNVQFDCLLNVLRVDLICFALFFFGFSATSHMHQENLIGFLLYCACNKFKPHEEFS